MNPIVADTQSFQDLLDTITSDHEATPSPDNLYWLLAYFVNASSPHFSRRAVSINLTPVLAPVTDSSKVGLLICGILGTSDRSRENLDNAPKNLKCEIGSLLLSTDCEDVRLVCGVLVRIQAIHGSDLSSLWPPKTDQRAPSTFPANPDSQWLVEFEDYVNNELTDLLPKLYVSAISRNEDKVLSNLTALPRSLGLSPLP